MADRFLVFGHSHHLLLNKFFDLSTPYMKKVDAREKLRVIQQGRKVARFEQF